jgi:O-antigen ligase
MSAATGVVLAAIGARVGPLAMVVAPLVVVVLLVSFTRPWLALPLVFLALPVGLMPIPGDALGLQVIQIAVLGSAVIVMLRRLAVGQLPLLGEPPLAWAALLVVAALVASASAVDHGLALKQDANLIAGVVLAFVAVTVIRTPRQAHVAAAALLAGATLITLPSLRSADKLRASFGGAVVQDRLQGSFNQPNELGAFAMVVTLVGCGLLFAARTRRQRLAVLAGLVPAVLALALSLSRGAWIGTALGGLTIFFLLPRARRAVVVYGIPVVIAGALLASAAPDNTQVQVVGERLSTVRHPAASPWDDRPRIWAEGWREVKLDPLTGHGPGNFPVVSTRSASGAQTVQAQHAHNALLTVAAEMGLPAVGLLLALTLATALSVRSALRVVRDRDAAVVVGLAAACAGIAGQGIIDYTYRNPVLFMVDWAILGMVVAAAAAARRVHRSAGPARG